MRVLLLITLLSCLIIGCSTTAEPDDNVIIITGRVIDWSNSDQPVFQAVVHVEPIPTTAWSVTTNEDGVYEISIGGEFSNWTVLVSAVHPTDGRVVETRVNLHKDEVRADMAFE
jgi:hypothetical protein